MSNPEKAVSVKITLSTLFWILGMVVAVYFLWRVQQIALTIFFAVIVMAALRPSVVFLQKRFRMPKILAILILYASLITALSLAFTLIVPPLVRELPVFLSSLSLPPVINHWSFDSWQNLSLSLTDLGSLLPQIGVSFNAILRIISSTFSGIFTFVTVLVMSIYLMLDRENLHLKMYWFTRNKRTVNLAKELIDSVEVQLGGWVRGQVSLMILIGVVTYIGLTLLGVPYALPLAIAAGALEVLPNLGPTIAAVPAIVIAFIYLGPWMAVFVTIFYILMQQFENHLIVPKIMKDNADVNPLITIILILVGLELGGVIGALLAVPIYIVIRSVYSMWYRERYRLAA